MQGKNTLTSSVICFALTSMHLVAISGQLFNVKQQQSRGVDVDARYNKQRGSLEMAEAKRPTQVANHLKSTRLSANVRLHCP